MQRHDPFVLPLETVSAASPLLGHCLEDRSSIRCLQDERLLEWLQSASTRPLANSAQRDLFVVAPLDILVSGRGAEKTFHIIELNGTGIGGVTNMTAAAVSAVLESLTQSSCSHWEPEGVTLVAISGKECAASPRLNRLVHEKLLFAEALRTGYNRRGSNAAVLPLPQLLSGEQPYRPGEPAVVLGYIKDLLNALTLDEEGRLHLAGRAVSAAVNDRFCLNVVNHFGRQVDLRRFLTVNRCFFAGGDKGVAYSLLNEYLEAEPSGVFPRRTLFEHASCRESLIEKVLHWKALGRQTVIKPHATGIGHGIEFFLDPLEKADRIIERIDESIRTTDRFYQASGGAFPYTLCEFVDACMIPPADHPLSGHKYELRVVVYRDRTDLKAFPSIVKAAGARFDPGRPDRAHLINNITASSVRGQTSGVEHMLPLCHRGTLQLLGVSVDELAEVCRVAAGYVRHVLDRVQQQPQRFGLPEARPGGRRSLPEIAVRRAA